MTAGMAKGCVGVRVIERKPLLGKLVARYLESISTPVSVSTGVSLRELAPKEIDEIDFILINSDQLMAADWDYLGAFRQRYPNKPVCAVTQFNPDGGRFGAEIQLFDRVFWVATELAGLEHELAECAQRLGSNPPANRQICSPQFPQHNLPHSARE